MGSYGSSATPSLAKVYLSKSAMCEWWEWFKIKISKKKNK